MDLKYKIDKAQFPEIYSKYNERYLEFSLTILVEDGCGDKEVDFVIEGATQVANLTGTRGQQYLYGDAKSYIYEIDDLLWDMPKTLLSASAWDRNKERLFFLLKNAFAITTSTQNIADKLYTFNSNIHIIPNVLGKSFLSVK